MRAAAISVFVFVGLGSLAIATQTVAGIFRDQPALGAPILRLQGAGVYWPWSIVGWSQQWRALYPRPFVLADFILMCGCSLGAIGAIAADAAGIPRLRRHGENGWADFAAVKDAGLFAHAGAILGKYAGEILTFDAPGHLLLVGASRSGKGRGHVVPTLLAWPHSALVLDIKGELAGGDRRHAFPGTAGFRETLGPVLRFAPTNAASARFNPLLEVRKGANEVRDVQNIVEIITDPAGDRRHEGFWDRSAKQVLVGLILHVLYCEPDHRKTLAVVRERLRDLDAQSQQMRLVLHRRNPETGRPETHPEVLHAAESYLSGEERMRSGIKATAESFFGIFGAIIPAALITGLNSDLPGRVIAQVTASVYDSVTGAQLLIPQGARLIGAYDNSVHYGDNRIVLVWNRLIMPNGWSIDLADMPGTDPTGAAGVDDRTNNHLWRLGGAIGLSAIISVIANNSEDERGSQSLTQSLGEAAAQQAAQTGGRIVERELTVHPTLQVRPGANVRVLVTRDIALRPYVEARGDVRPSP